MRYFLFLLPLVVAGCAETYPAGYGYGPSAQYPSAQYPSDASGYSHNYGYYNENPPAASGYAYNSSAYGQSSAYDPNNCGTPDEPYACPPMPRRPLPYYPPNRW